MVFCNYATMEMSAKIVYYGPGLCGKTTNLHHIYGHTSPKSRGEMISLDTDTERTLFFDVLPVDVGVIAGFKTRLQLYTVPGQVFYNATRKLVLNGVDGIVFVADSQRSMRNANKESLENLVINLSEIGLTLQDVPLVLQYNKRDLPDILALDELNSMLNPTRTWEVYEAVALDGTGVFETLKAISRVALRAIPKRLLGDTHTAAPATRQAPAPVPPVAVKAATSPAVEAEAASAARATGARRKRKAGKARKPAEPAPEVQPLPLSAAAPIPAQPTLAAAAPPPAPPVPERFEVIPSTPPPPAEVLIKAPATLVEEQEEAWEVSFAETPAAAPIEQAAPVKHVHVGSNVDLMAELEKLRKSVKTDSPKAATGARVPAPEPSPPAKPAAAPQPTGRPAAETPAVLRDAKPAERRKADALSLDDLLAAAGINHHREVSQRYEVEIAKADLQKSRHLTICLRLENEARQSTSAERQFSIELKSLQDIEKLLLSLKFQITGR